MLDALLVVVVFTCLLFVLSLLVTVRSLHNVGDNKLILILSLSYLPASNAECIVNCHIN